MEVEIIACKEDEIFDLYKISQLIDFNFSRKSQKSCTFIPASFTRLILASISPIFGLLTPILANILIYLMHKSGTRPTPGAYIQSLSTEFPLTTHRPPGMGLKPVTYIQPSGITFILAYVQPSNIGYTLISYIILSPNTISADYIQPSIKLIYLAIDHTLIFYITPANHLQPLTRAANLAVYHPLFASQLLAITVTISIGHNKELSNLVKIYTDKTRYSGRNHSFNFKMVISQNIYSKIEILSKTKLRHLLLYLKTWLQTTII